MVVTLWIAALSRLTKTKQQKELHPVCLNSCLTTVLGYHKKPSFSILLVLWIDEIRVYSMSK